MQQARQMQTRNLWPRDASAGQAVEVQPAPASRLQPAAALTEQEGRRTVGREAILHLAGMICTMSPCLSAKSNRCWHAGRHHDGKY